VIWKLCVLVSRHFVLFGDEDDAAVCCGCYEFWCKHDGSCKVVEFLRVAPATDFLDQKQGRKNEGRIETYTVDLPPRAEREGMRPRAGAEVVGVVWVRAGGVTGGMDAGVGRWVGWLLVDDVEEDEEGG
jgi:hypothetical protein